MVYIVDWARKGQALSGRECIENRDEADRLAEKKRSEGYVAGVHEVPNY